MKRNIVLSIVASVLFGVNTDADAQKNKELRPVTIDFFTQVNAISDVKTIGDDIFFVIRKASLKDDKYTSDLYQLVDGKAKALTASGIVGGYDILDDAIILKKRDKEQTVFLELTRGYGEATEWLRLPYQIGQVKYINRQHFFFTASYKLQQGYDGLPDSLKANDADKRYRIFDELPFWSNGRGDTNGLRQVLYEYKDGQVRALTDSLTSVGGFALSPDHRYLAYTVSDKRNFRYYGNQLHTYSIHDRLQREVGFIDSTSYGSLQFIDGHHLFLTAKTYSSENPQANGVFYTLDINTGQSEKIYDGEQYELGVDYAPLVRLSLKDGKVVPLTSRQYDIDAYLKYKKGYLLLATEAQGGQEFYLFDGKNELRRISDINTSTFAAHWISNPQEVKYTNKAGTVLSGYVLPPANYEPGKKYPAILNIHGGPRCAYGTGFFHEMQYWANKGYAVIFANPRGSSGNGSGHALLKGDFGGRDYDDLMSFVDATLDHVVSVIGHRLRQ